MSSAHRSAHWGHVILCLFMVKKTPLSALWIITLKVMRICLSWQKGPGCERNITLCFSSSKHWRGRGRPRGRDSSWFMPNSGGGNSWTSARHTSPKWWRYLHRFVLEPTEEDHSDLCLYPRGAASLPQSLYPQDENGVNKPVCSYVRVLQAGRLLESPRHAARFVSLLAHQRAPVVGGGSTQEQWCTLLAFLCRQKVQTSPGGWFVSVGSYYTPDLGPPLGPQLRFWWFLILPEMLKVEQYKFEDISSPNLEKYKMQSD